MSSRRSFLKFLGLAPAVAVATTVEAKPSKELSLSDAIAQLEKGRVVKEGLLRPFCQTGNQYLAITHGGIKAEGAEFIGFNNTPQEAIRGWLNAALLYAKDRPGTLYWREKPSLDCRIEFGGRPDWMVYSRFVITDNPEIHELLEVKGDDRRYRNGVF